MQLKLLLSLRLMKNFMCTVKIISRIAERHDEHDEEGRQGTTSKNVSMKKHNM
jgi:hypothetical protein